MSRRQLDMHAESELASFLDTYFYNRLIETGQITSAQRVFDKETQKLGIDVIVKKGTKQALIDEKAQLYYINIGLPTFAFELSFLNTGVEKLGWFLNEELLTDRYFLLWPYATTQNLSCLKANDFTSIDGLMIKKSEIQLYLEAEGMSRRYLLNKVQDLRRNAQVGKHPSGYNGINFYVSDPKQYAERPINLVVNKSILESIASAAFHITPDVLKKL